MMNKPPQSLHPSDDKNLLCGASTHTTLLKIYRSDSSAAVWKHWFNSCFLKVIRAWGLCHQASWGYLIKIHTCCSIPRINNISCKWICVCWLNCYSSEMISFLWLKTILGWACRQCDQMDGASQRKAGLQSVLLKGGFGTWVRMKAQYWVVDILRARPYSRPYILGRRGAGACPLPHFFVISPPLQESKWANGPGDVLDVRRIFLLDFWLLSLVYRKDK